MKKAFILFIVFCSFCISLSYALYAEQIPIKGYVSPDIGINVRTGPSESDEIIAALPQGTDLSIVSVSNGWYKISSPMQGYVSGEFVSVTEYGEAPEETEEETYEDQETDEDKPDDETTLTQEEVDKIGCNINKSLNNAKVTKAPPHNL